MQSIFSNLDLVGGEEEGHRSNLQMQLNWFESSYKLQTELHHQQRGRAGGLQEWILIILNGHIPTVSKRFLCSSSVCHCGLCKLPGKEKSILSLTQALPCTARCEAFPRRLGSSWRVQAICLQNGTNPFLSACFALHLRDDDCVWLVFRKEAHEFQNSSVCSFVNE